MARKNPLGTIKDAALGTLRAPLTVAEKAVGQMGRVAGAGADVMTALVPGKLGKAVAPAPAPARAVAVPAEPPLKAQGDPLTPVKKATAKKAPATKAPAPAKKATAKKAPATKAAAPAPAPVATAAPATPAKKAAAPKPVNVIEELGLDPAPVALTPAPAEPQPVTSIDANATAEEVVATPADVAAVLDSDEARDG